jgi:hypothetical protein
VAVCDFCVYLSICLSISLLSLLRSGGRIQGSAGWGMGGFLLCSYFAMLSVQHDPRTELIYLLSSFTIQVQWQLR